MNPQVVKLYVSFLNLKLQLLCSPFWNNSFTLFSYYKEKKLISFAKKTNYKEVKLSITFSLSNYCTWEARDGALLQVEERRRNQGWCWGFSSINLGFMVTIGVQLRLRRSGFSSSKEQGSYFRSPEKVIVHFFELAKRMIIADLWDYMKDSWTIIGIKERETSTFCTVWNLFTEVQGKLAFYRIIQTMSNDKN